jgi:hypothetical protein
MGVVYQLIFFSTITKAAQLLARAGVRNLTDYGMMRIRDFTQRLEQERNSHE